MGLSDHCATYIILKKKKVTYGTTTFTCRVMDESTTGKIQMQLANIRWDDFYALDDYDSAWNYFYGQYLTILDEVCPEKHFKNVKHNSEWISSQLFELMIKRDALFVEAKTCNDDNKWAQVKSFRNMVNEKCKNTKANYVQSKLEITEGNPRKFWRELQPLLKVGPHDRDTMVELEDPLCNNSM